MPELPEVEVIRRALVARIVGREIVEARVSEPRLTRRRGSPADVARAVVGRRIEALRRRGKFLVFVLGEESLIVRLGMTGQLLWWDTRERFQPDGHTHAHLRFARGGILSYRDVRKFGEMFLLPTHAVDATLGLGVEPLEPIFTVAALQTICRGSRARVKPLLLDQKKIAGIGNIYADEALYRAGVRPMRRATSLRPAEIRLLWRSIRAVLREGIRHRGSSISDYRDPSGQPGDFGPLHRVYHRHGTPCRVCGTVIRRTILAQRGTHYCPNCQR